MVNPAHEAIAMQRTLILQGFIVNLLGTVDEYLNLHEGNPGAIESANAWEIVQTNANGVQTELATFVANIADWGIGYQFRPGCLAHYEDVSQTLTDHLETLLDTVVGGGMTRAIAFAHLLHLLTSIHDPYHEGIPMPPAAAGA